MQILNPQIIQNVKSAMLCIQRLQWEQGCAAQAILEYDGLNDEVVRLCEAAVLRAAADGRVGVMEKNESVDDPAAIGEALIYGFVRGVCGMPYFESTGVAAEGQAFLY